MTSIKMKKLLEERLANPNWETSYHSKQDTLKVTDKEHEKGVTISLPGIISKWEVSKEKAIDEVVYYVEESLHALRRNDDLSGKEKQIYPVIRSTSFPTETKEGKKLLFTEHTAETRIYYAIDLGATYKLVDEKMMEREGWQVEQVKQIATFNVRSLPVHTKEDQVAGNIFYFLNTNDGYDASRILNDALLDKFEKQIEGKMAVAVPHQDVLVIADIRNETGYDILAQMNMSFFTNGLVPITALSFLYNNGELEPIFILGKNKPKRS
ncbi:DUF1444 domain-containing protein [Bacillus pinisoli]|uniref:DUF1444 domain-containing protein n=1 Tax=Bacillus pinisoli TaxID=2901866 RepID=UPI001FF3EEBA|nr:DUF1444 domain-containing protein [Bacillus pinisoli]